MQLDTAQTPHHNTAHCDTFATSLCEENISFHTSSHRTTRAVFSTMHMLSKIIAKFHTNTQTVENIRSPFTASPFYTIAIDSFCLPSDCVVVARETRRLDLLQHQQIRILGRSLSTMVWYIYSWSMICNKLFFYFTIEYLKMTAQFDLN